MSTTIFLLTYAPLLAPGLVPQRTFQEGRTARANAVARPVPRTTPGSRVPVDVSLIGGGQSNAVIAGGPTIQAPLVVDPKCVASIRDQSDACIEANSTATFGMLFPYPGINNTFVAPALVGGGEKNQATGSWSTIAASVSASVSLRKTLLPVSVSNRRQPNAQMSARLSIASPRTCSGLM